MEITENIEGGGAKKGSCLRSPQSLEQNTTDWVAYQPQKCIAHSSGGGKYQHDWRLECQHGGQGPLPGHRSLIVSSHGGRG